MEITSGIADVSAQELKSEHNVKPMKGENFDADVQQFEHIMFGDQIYQSKGVTPTENSNTPNAVSKIGETLINLMGDYKKSTDSRISSINNLAKNDHKILRMEDIVKVHWQITLFSLETTLMASSGDKVSQGVQTLFRNQ